MPSLLAVDLGLRTGLALYGPDGRLTWYRSHHLASRAALRRAVSGVLDPVADLDRLVLEGGGPLAEIWLKEAGRRGLATRLIAAEDWRATLLRPDVRRDRAKHDADALARRVIA